jgi:hypothetical protein
MKALECEFESEVLAAILQSRWPERVEADLREHAAGCQICSDVAAIADAFDPARQETLAQAAVPPAARVWRLAQLRARREALREAARPITAVQALAFAAAFGALGACFGATSTWLQSALRSVASSAARFDAGALMPSAFALVAGHGAILIAAAAAVLLIPAGVYLVVSRD